MRTAAGLHSHDPLRRQSARARQDERVLLGVDVIGNGDDVVSVPEALAKRLHECGLAGADGAAHANAQRAVRSAGHERKSLVYWVSWRRATKSDRNAAPPR